MPWSWGGEFNSTVRVGRNEHGYRLGDRYLPGLWLARQMTTGMSVSAGATGEMWGNIRGSDALLDPAEEPTKDPKRQGGTRLNALLGVELHPMDGFFKGQQFYIQGDVPVVQSLDGPQLQRKFMMHVAWQFGF